MRMPEEQSAVTEEMKKRVCRQIDGMRDRLCELSDTIHDYAELGTFEFKTSELLRNELKKHDFHFSRLKIGRDMQVFKEGLRTAIKASYRGGPGGPTIAFVGELDALPEIGHGCGHNMIAVSALGAAVAVRNVIYNLSGTVEYIGAPAEERYLDNSGGKVIMLSDFSTKDAAIMMHPGTDWKILMSGSYGLPAEALEFRFRGRTTHVATKGGGINALHAALLTFDAFNALKHLVKDGEVIQAVISKEGLSDFAASVPENAAIRLHVRSHNLRTLTRLVKRVKNCAKGAAVATGAKLTMRNFAPTYVSIRANETLALSAKLNFERLGIRVKEERGEATWGGSSDFGNVSQLIPGISMPCRIAPSTVTGHTAEMAKATLTRMGHSAFITTTKAMAMTAIDIYTKRETLGQMKADQERNKKKRIR